MSRPKVTCTGCARLFAFPHTCNVCGYKFCHLCIKSHEKEEKAALDIKVKAEELG